jgi:L-histidine Nalpha-methyltransferase
MLPQTRVSYPDRLTIERLPDGGDKNAFAADVLAGLTKKAKALQPKYFYDELGSRLFEAICRLPEYYLTRAEAEILKHRAEEIVAAVAGPVRLIELGSGSAEKTRHIIEALLRRQPELQYVPVDISDASLESSSRELLRTYQRLRITAYAGDYFTALRAIAKARMHSRGSLRTIALFLGSNIGNFDPQGAQLFLKNVRETLKPRDALLIGADLKKDRETLEAAYDDPLGVTSAFNLNLLLRMNRELAAEFDVSKFKHHAVYNEELGRVEIYIVSLEKQTIRIGALDVEVSFDEGETIHTENSYKFDLDQLSRIADQTGYTLAKTWFDRSRRFSFNLFAAA